MLPAIQQGILFLLMEEFSYPKKLARRCSRWQKQEKLRKQMRLGEKEPTNIARYLALSLGNIGGFNY
jgi:hypothetical protein